MKYVLDSKINTLRDEIEQFMIGITTISPSFPAKDRAIAETKTLKIVSDTELEIRYRLSTTNFRVSTPSSNKTNHSENTPMSDTFQDFY